MDDLISRQTAIKYLNEVWTNRPLDSERYVVEKCMDAISDIPSAQKWISITTRPMTEDERQEWSEKLGSKIDDDEVVIYGNLPDDGQSVLIYKEYSKTVDIDTFCDDGDGCYFEDNGDMDGITHWMPLPEPPKDVKA